MVDVGSQQLRLIIAAALVLMLAAPVLSSPTTALGASPQACVVKNVTRGGKYTSFDKAIKRARNKDRLTVRGVCRARAGIANKKLTIAGVRTATSGPATLKGTGRGPVLKVGGDFANVLLKNLVIRGKRAQVLDYDGGGLYQVNGRLSLRNVIVKDFKGTPQVHGGGIHNTEGVLRLLGTTTVRTNRGYGAGIYDNSGTVILRGRSVVRNNRGAGIVGIGPFARVHLYDKASVSDNAGTGVQVSEGTVTMHGRSTIRDNSAENGGGIRSHSLSMSDQASIRGNSATFEAGGVWVGDHLKMRDAAVVTGNHAGVRAGGLKADLSDTLDGVVCDTGSGGNVRGNTPDDCLID
jgi:hypothetical protein